MFQKFLSPLLPLLHVLDAEKAHDNAIRALEGMAHLSSFFCPKEDDPRLKSEIFGLNFRNPIGLAAGFDKNARVPDVLMKIGFGFVEVGGVTPLPQPGNPQPRVFRLNEDEAIINRYGLNSEGMEAVAVRLQKRKKQGVLGINLGANKESEDRIGDYILLFDKLGPYADFVTLNISSPNTPGLRDLQGEAFLEELLTRIQTSRAQKASPPRILLKIAPDLGDHQLDTIIACAKKHKIDGMIIANTTIARPASLVSAKKQENGGLSGKPLFRPATIMLAKAFLRVEGAFPLIGVGGITSGEDAVTKIAAGASLVQLYSGLVYKGPALLGDMKTAIVNAMSRQNVTNLAGLIGQNAKIWSEAEEA